MDSDEELFLRYRSGEAVVFEELLGRFKAPLFGVILKMVGDRADAEDVFQETLYRVIRHAEEFNPELRFSSWIFSIALNLCRDHLRRRGRSPIQAVAEVPDFAVPHTPESDSWRGEVRKAVGQAIAKLPEEQREVFTLREYGGLEFKEIARLTNSNLNTVLGRMHLAVKKLRAELTGLGGDNG